MPEAAPVFPLDGNPGRVLLAALLVTLVKVGLRVAGALRAGRFRWNRLGRFVREDLFAPGVALGFLAVAARVEPAFGMVFYPAVAAWVAQELGSVRDALRQLLAGRGTGRVS